MSNPIRFGEAARLFAENAAVVEAMREEFRREVDDFLERLRVATESFLPEPVRARNVPGYRYGWTAPTASEKAAGA